MTTNGTGDTVVMTWFGGRSIAYSINHDDNRSEHIDYAVPMLNTAGIRGTFNVIPGATSWSTYSQGFIDAANPDINPVETVNGVVLAHELASHTWAHKRFRYFPSDDPAITSNNYWYFFGPDIYGYGEPGLYTEAQVFDLMAQDCTQTIGYLDSVQPRRTVVLAYPFGARNSDSEQLALGYFLAARGSMTSYVAPMVNSESPTNMGLVIGVGTGTTLSSTAGGPQTPVNAAAYNGQRNQVQISGFDASFGHRGEIVHLSGGDPPFITGWYLVVAVDTTNDVYTLTEDCTAYGNAGENSPGALLGFDWAVEEHCNLIFQKRLDYAKAQGGWLIESFHNVVSGIHEDVYGKHAIAVASDPDLWVAPIGDVARYIYSRDAALVSVAVVNENLIELTADDGLADEVFDFPLTLRTEIPLAWGADLSVLHDGSPIENSVWMDAGKAYAMYSVPADGGNVLIRPSGCCDPDGDGDVDLADYGMLPNCLAGPGTMPNPSPPESGASCLAVFDTDGDSDVDLADFATFQSVFTGPR